MSFVLGALIQQRDETNLEKVSPLKKDKMASQSFDAKEINRK